MPSTSAPLVPGSTLVSLSLSVPRSYSSRGLHKPRGICLTENLLLGSYVALFTVGMVATTLGSWQMIKVRSSTSQACDSHPDNEFSFLYRASPIKCTARWIPFGGGQDPIDSFRRAPASQSNTHISIQRDASLHCTFSRLSVDLHTVKPFGVCCLSVLIAI